MRVRTVSRRLSINRLKASKAHTENTCRYPWTQSTLRHTYVHTRVQERADARAGEREKDVLFCFQLARPLES